MTNHRRTQVSAYLHSKYGEIIHFKTFNTDVSVDEVFKEIASIKKDIIRIHMDRNYGEQDFYIV